MLPHKLEIREESMSLPDMMSAFALQQTFQQRAPMHQFSAKSESFKGQDESSKRSVNLRLQDF